jgi:hypothetical protein
VYGIINLRSLGCQRNKCLDKWSCNRQYCMHCEMQKKRKNTNKNLKLYATENYYLIRINCHIMTICYLCLLNYLNCEVPNHTQITIQDPAWMQYVIPELVYLPDQNDATWGSPTQPESCLCSWDVSHSVSDNPTQSSPLELKHSWWGTKLPPIKITYNKEHVNLSMHYII